MARTRPTTPPASWRGSRPPRGAGWGERAEDALRKAAGAGRAARGDARLQTERGESRGGEVQIGQERTEFPESVIKAACEPNVAKADDERAGSLANVAAEDPVARCSLDVRGGGGQAVIEGAGKLRLGVLIDRLLREFEAACSVGARPLARRDVTSKIVAGRCPQRGQSGGPGQRAEARVARGPGPDAGSAFANQCTGAVLPREYVLAALVGPHRRR